MNIIVKYRSVYGKDLFYPLSEDASFIVDITGRPTILKRQLDLFVKRGWSVTITRDKLEDTVKALGEKLEYI